MKDVDVGPPLPAAFLRLERRDSGRSVAAFVSRYGDVFCLERPEIELRIRYLEAQDLDTIEEKRALAALARERT